MIKVDTIIASDFHLGSENCQAKLCLDTLLQYQCKRLILNGDLVEDDQVFSFETKMNWHQFQLIEHFRRMLKKEMGVKLIRTAGNHDCSGHDFMNQVLGIKSLKKKLWKVNGKVFCVIHGHQFDRFVFKNRFLSKVISKIFLFLQKYDTRSRTFSRWLDRLHGRWFRLSELVAQGAIGYAHKKKIDVIICGHTHQPLRLVDCKNGHTVCYWNTGGWTDTECSFLTIDDQGEVTLRAAYDKEPVLV